MELFTVEATRSILNYNCPNYTSIISYVETDPSQPPPPPPPTTQPPIITNSPANNNDTTNNNTHKDGDSRGLVIGLSVGIVVLILVLLTVMVCVICRKRYGMSNACRN